jgi:hypothetical protein
MSSENGSKKMLIIMDISFVSDGWSYMWNPERFLARPSWRFPTTATSPAKSSRGHGPTDRTPQPASAGSDRSISSPVLRS